jgi:hypothetical protein
MQFAGIGRLYTRKYLYERTLPSAISTQQGMDFAVADDEIY